MPLQRLQIVTRSSRIVLCDVQHDFWLETLVLRVVVEVDQTEVDPPSEHTIEHRVPMHQLLAHRMADLAESLVLHSLLSHNE